MEIKEISSQLVDEKYYRISHNSGLTIFVYPKLGYNGAYAVFGTKYGSINRSFSLDKEKSVTVPDGIAHYLEHKLFESEDGDAFVRYAKTGANANAYTSFDKTCYLFSCTEKFDESLEILLDFVQSPYFTDETVAKEQGIIGQEIKMYDDSPEWRVMFNMLGAMYKTHPVKIDIAGTVESIAKITPEYLYECYNTFYNLNNMVLTVAGDVTVEQVLGIADRMLKKCEKHDIQSVFEEEPYEVTKPYIEQSLPVMLPLFNLGFKERVGKTRSSAKNIALTDILLNLLASQISPMYRELMDNNLINSGFSYEFFEGEGFCSTIFSGESRSPKQVAETIKRYVTMVKKDGINKEDFEIAKKAVYGETVSSLNSIDNIANSVTDLYFSDRELYDYIEAVASATCDDVTNRLQELLDVNNCTLSVIRGQE